MSGILVVDKPEGFTSFDVVAKLRGICGTRKIGHGGTLDPMATGVLPVFVGGAVKAVDLAPNQDKAYMADILLGTSTTTGDITGEVLQSVQAAVTTQQLQEVLPSFLGPQKQLPPMYSAVKINGKPLYKYAREGKTVERKPRDVIFHELALQSEVEQGNRCRLFVRCSKGTYVRTLVEDIGAALGLPATLAGLRRTAAGVFSLQQAYTLQQIQTAKDAGELQNLFCSVEKVFESLPVWQAEPQALRRIYNGAQLQLPLQEGRYRAVNQGRFLGVIQADQSGAVRAVKMFERGEDT